MKTSSLKNLYVSDPVIGGVNSTSEGRRTPARLNTSPQFTSNCMESNPVCHEVQLSSSTATLNIPQVSVSDCDDDYKCSGNLIKDYYRLCETYEITTPPPIMTRNEQGNLRPPIINLRSLNQLPMPDTAYNYPMQQFITSQQPDRTGLLRRKKNNPGEKSNTVSQPDWNVPASAKYSIQVKMLDHSSPTLVSEICVRNWRVSHQLSTVLSKCLPALTHLDTISFWNAGLTEESLAVLAGSLDACKCLNYLSVEANVPTLANFHLLTDSDSSIRYLYLRYNNIDSHTLLRVVQPLCGTNSKNNNIVLLNLSGNKIRDEGCEAIKKMLRMNRTVTSLCLADNEITDQGVKVLRDVLQEFPLTADEQKQRSVALVIAGLSPTSSSCLPIRRLQSSVPQSVPPANTKTTDKKVKHSSTATKHGRVSASHRHEASGRLHTSSKTKITERRKTEKIIEPPVVTQTEPNDNITPQQFPTHSTSGQSRKVLLEHTLKRGGKVWLRQGNITLQNLNLSRNFITEDGFEMMVSTLNQQLVVQRQIHEERIAKVQLRTPLPQGGKLRRRSLILAVAAAQVMGSRKKSTDHQKANPHVSQAPCVQPSPRTTGLKHVLMSKNKFTVTNQELLKKVEKLGSNDIILRY